MTVQGRVKKLQPDGMSHRGRVGRGGLPKALLVRTAAHHRRTPRDRGGYCGAMPWGPDRQHREPRNQSLTGVFCVTAKGAHAIVTDDVPLVSSAVAPPGGSSGAGHTPPKRGAGGGEVGGLSFRSGPTFLLPPDPLATGGGPGPYAGHPRIGHPLGPRSRLGTAWLLGNR